MAEVASPGWRKDAPGSSDRRAHLLPTTAHTHGQETHNDDAEDNADPPTFSQLLRDGMDDAMDALEAGDDGGTWHVGRPSSYKGKSSNDENDVHGLEGGLDAIMWLPKLLWGVENYHRPRNRGGEGESLQRHEGESNVAFGKPLRDGEGVPSTVGADQGCVHNFMECGFLALWKC